MLELGYDLRPSAVVVHTGWCLSLAGVSFSGRESEQASSLEAFPLRWLEFIFRCRHGNLGDDPEKLKNSNGRSNCSCPLTGWSNCSDGI